MLARNGTCWVWDVLAFSFLHLSFFGTIASVVLSSGILGRCLHNHRKTLVSSVYLCCFRGKAFLGKPTSSRLVENTHGSNLDCRLYNNSFAPALGGACAMETNTVALIRTRQIQAIITLPETLSFSAQLMRCNVSR